MYSKNIKNNFETNGYVTLKSFIKPVEAKKIKKNLFSFLKNKIKKKSKKREMHFADNSKLINSVHNLKWPFIKKFKKNKRIIKIAENLLGGKIKSFGAEVFAKPAKVGMAVPIHQDNFYWNVNNSKGLTVWLALDKASKKNGAIFYFKKSHKRGLFRHESSFAPGSSQKLKNMNILKKFKKVTPILNTGDVLIHHCLVVHGSERNKSNKDRAGLTLRYIGNSSRIIKSAKEKYEKSLKKQLS